MSGKPAGAEASTGAEAMLKLCARSYEYTAARYYKHLPGTDEEHVVMLQSPPGGDDDGDMLLGVDGDEWAALDDNGDGNDDDDYLDGQYDLDAQAYAGDAWM